MNKNPETIRNCERTYCGFGEVVHTPYAAAPPELGGVSPSPPIAAVVTGVHRSQVGCLAA